MYGFGWVKNPSLSLSPNKYNKVVQAAVFATLPLLSSLQTFFYYLYNV